ncbi:chloride channel protein [Kitasatospora sp. NPDC094011]|uniref:chloride channel protein n=1 Tax=Kitasatospora sp. NPDC094011 TaxID=3364090 RepID=UPI00382E53CF
MAEEQTSAETVRLHVLLRDRGYRRLLLVSGLVGIPVSLAAFGFVSLAHALEHGVWEALPQALGWSRAPWWWPLPTLLVCGTLVALAVTRLPGRGGHVPVGGLDATPTRPRDLPGIVLAALASLGLGAVLGPEAPLMALGSGLALLAVRPARREQNPRLAPVLGAAGSAAAISTVFGNPLVAAVLLIEAAGIGGPQLFLLMLPCLLSSGVGALVFTGFGRWSGFGIGALNLPTVPPDRPPAPGDFLWGVPLAAVIACVVVAATRLGRVVADRAARHTAATTIAAALAVGACAGGYALATGRSPEEVALSGQATLAHLAADPGSRPVSALLLLVVFKGVAWGLSLGSLRGGPVFPALLIGPALATALAGAPGFAPAPALAVGMAAAGAAVLRLPVSAAVLASLLLGRDAADQLPLVVIAAVVAFAVGEVLRARGLPAAESGERSGTGPS